MPHYRDGPHAHREYPHPPPRPYEQQNELLDDFRPTMPRSEPVRCMKRGEQVEVRIRGNIWIVGFLVSSLHVISSYLGQGYDVEYVDHRSGKAFQAPFSAEDVRPVARQEF